MKHEFSNLDALLSAVEAELIGVTDELADRVHKVLLHFVQDYYEGYSPVMYQRKYDFLNAVVKVGARRTKNGAEAHVYIDYDSMDGYKDVSGLQVVTWANEGLHGGYKAPGHAPHVWNDTMAATIDNGELLRLAIKYLRQHGIPVSR